MSDDLSYVRMDGITRPYPPSLISWAAARIVQGVIM